MMEEQIWSKCKRKIMKEFMRRRAIIDLYSDLLVKYNLEQNRGFLSCGKDHKSKRLVIYMSHYSLWPLVSVVRRQEFG